MVVFVHCIVYRDAKFRATSGDNPNFERIFAWTTLKWRSNALCEPRTAASSLSSWVCSHCFATSAFGILFKQLKVRLSFERSECGDCRVRDLGMERAG